MYTNWYSPPLKVDNSVIGYIDGLAITRDAWGNLHFVSIPEELVAVGDYIDLDDVTPLSALPQPIQDRIIKEVLL